MVELVLFSNPMSQPSRSVQTFLEISKLKYELKEVNIFAGDHLKRSFRAINPHQEIPVLLHQGFYIWESPAIVQYLSEKFDIDNSYFPKNPEQRAKIVSYLHWHHEHVRRPIVNYMKKKVIYPMVLGKPEPSKVQEDKLKTKMNEVLISLEWLLQSSQFLARSENVTIADVFAFNEIISASLVELNIAKFPRLMSWFEKVAAIPELLRVCGSLISDYREFISKPKL